MTEEIQEDQFVKSEEAPQEELQTEELVKQCAELTAKNAELEEQIKRSMADYQNLLRRSQQEKERMTKYAYEPAMLAIIPCFNNFFFAFRSFNESSSAEQLLKSIQMLWTSLFDSLGTIGFTKIDETGRPYDVNTQEALNQVENDELEEGTVVEVMRPGFSLNGKVLQPAQVTVSVKPKSE